MRSLRKRAILLATAAALLALPTGAAQAEGDTLRLLTYNIWNKFKQRPDLAAQLLIPGNYDAVLFQEENGSRFVTDLPGILGEAGLGQYQGARRGSSGILSRLPGTVGSYQLPDTPNTNGRNITFAVADAAGGRPATTIGSIHLDYADTSGNRLREAGALVEWVKQQNGPVIMGGDFNAGDVSERGLHDVTAQIRLIRTVGNNSLYRDLAYQYIANGDEAVMRQVIQDSFPGQNIDSLSWNQWGTALATAAAQGRDVGLRDETYPVASNIPVTMNVLKKDFVMMQTEAIREGFAPHPAGDGSTTWPSYGEDATNTWTSWDRVKIDHFLVSRPYAKWYALTDDPADQYLGVVDKFYVDLGNGQTAPLSDHEPVGHEFTWVGPQLEKYAGALGEQTRLVWGEGASTFESRDGVFNLTRNNARTDVYLGQVSDANGIPTLDWLTEAEKKTLLDCGSSDSRLAGAIAEYCIDDHSFISETLVTDGGIVAVTEDAALGGAAARLRLADGSLRIDGTEMTTLGREVSLEGEGGILSVADAGAAVTASGVISGEGDLSKQGDGVLRLAAVNTYTGSTTVEAGTLLVNGSTVASAGTTVMGGAVIGGIGHLSNLELRQSAILRPGDMGIGTLFVDGDLSLDSALLDFEIGASGYDKLVVAGDFTALSDYSLSFSFLDGLFPGTSDFFEFLTVGGDFSGVLDFAKLLLPLSGEFAGLNLFGDNKGTFALAWTNPYQVAAVPLPLPALMLLSGLGVLAAMRRRTPKTA
ncbi:endonuclease/exonuclease/phosphatase family protein [Pseudotabrizicola formosa]|uniref:endonuclease/exonuclease/phosphatase family protein n=1 Tax=Pseudotabrizicola formosa TaxID=2030009 RepID=UPI00143D6669|nr:endonuclease/exonuclease/phosphatase family protein [Pseudotabrizicola formosa]